MKKINFTFFVFYCFLMIANAQWQKINIADSPNIVSMVRDNSDDIFAITLNNNVYRSTDNGGFWLDCTNDLNSYLQAIISTPSAILIGTYGNGIFRSTNHGQNWVPSNSGLNTNYIQSFCLKDNFVFVGGQGGLYRSSNDGISWVNASNGIAFTHGIYAMESKQEYIFAESAIGSQGTMYVSTNNGEYWNSANSGLPGFFTTSLAVSNNTVYTTMEKVYQTTNNGQNWTLTSGLPYTCGSTVSSVSSLENIITVCYSNESSHNFVFISTDYGFSFFPTGNDLPIWGVKSCLIKNNGIFAATPKGVYKTTNFGANWFEADSGFSDIDFNAVMSESSIVLAGSKNHGIYRSMNSGQSWELVNAFNSSSTCFNFLIDIYKIYSLGTYGLILTYDYGVHWETIPRAGPPAGNLLKYYVKDQLIIGAYSGGIYKTINSGVNWNKCETGITSQILKVNSIFINDSISLIQLQDSNLINILYKSTNHGNSWNLILNSGLQDNSINCFSQNQTSIYAGTGNGIYISTNNGNNWVARNNGLTAGISSILFNNGIIYTGSQFSGIYRSTDNAFSWQPYNEGIINNTIYSINLGYTTMYAEGKGSFYIRNLNTFVNNLGSNIPDKYYLYQNYPNPFNPVTKIKFDIPSFLSFPHAPGGNPFVILRVYDILGKEIQTLVNEQLQPGTYEVTFDGSNLPSGVYFYQLKASDFVSTKKLVLLK